MATGWALALLLAILLGSALILLAGAVGLGQYLRLRGRKGACTPGPAWLSGTARRGDRGSLAAPVSGEPALGAVWAVEREGGKVARRVWRTVETRREDVPFVLDTDAGQVRVDPANAGLDLAEDTARTFDDPAALREALPAQIPEDALGEADRYRLVEQRLSPGDTVDVTGRLESPPEAIPAVTGPADPSLLRRLLDLPSVIADPDRDGGAGLLRDRALAGFVLGVPPALLALVLMFPP